MPPSRSRSSKRRRTAPSADEAGPAGESDNGGPAYENEDEDEDEDNDEEGSARKREEGGEGGGEKAEGEDLTESVTQGVFLFNAKPSNGGGSALSSSSSSRSSKKGKKKSRSKQATNNDATAEDADAEPAAGRRALFAPCWSAMERDINRLLAEQNQKVFGDLVTFFRSHNESQYHFFQPTRHSPFNEVPTAVLLTGINSPDHAVMFGALAAYIEADLTPHVVQLRSSMCRGLKGMVKMVVDALLRSNPNESGVVKQGTINYDIQILQSWFVDQEVDVADADADADADVDADADADGSGSSRGSHRLVDYDDDDDSDEGTGTGSAKGTAMTKAATPSAARETGSGGGRRPIVIIFEDFEAFDIDALGDFIVVCSQRRTSLPIVFLFGVASSAGILARQLPRKAICALNTSKFRLRQSSATLSDVVSQVVMSPNHPFKLGPRPLQQLVDNFLYHNLSISSFTRGLKLAALTHFIRNPMSTLCNVDENGTVSAGTLDEEQLESLRQTLPFRELVENEEDHDKQRMLLVDDAYLSDQIPELTEALQSQQTMFRVAVLCLRVLVAAYPDTVHGLSKFLPSLYAACLRERFLQQDKMQELWPLLVTSAADTLVEILHEFESIVEATMVQSSMEVNVGALEKLGELAAKFRQHRKDIEERNDAPPLPGATAGSGDGGGGGGGGGGGAAAAAGGGKVAAAKPSASDILSGIGGSRTSGAASAAKSRRALLSGAKAKKETPFSRLRKFIVESLKGFFETELVPPTSNLLASGFFFEGSLKGMLEGSPRGTIENALNSPSQYLGDSMASQPDTVILYTLHLECGRLVNIYDLLMSFAEVASPDTKCTKMVQARFFRALSELQYLGYMQATKRKTDHMVRLTSGHA